MTRSRAALLLGAALLLPGLFARGLWPPDETRYADVARAMLADGHWIVPHLHGELYGEKPPVFFWATAALAALGAPLEMGPRLVSTLAALATLALLPGIAASLGWTRDRGATAALVLATTPLFWAYGQLGLLDATSTALVTAAVAAKLARAGRSGPGCTALAIAEGLALGAALLVKGPVLLLFPIGLRLGAAFARAPGPARADASDAAALGVAAGVVGAWLLAAAHQGGSDYVRSITLGQAVNRVRGDAPHLRPPGFLLAITLAGCLPWVALALGGVRDRIAALRRGARPGPAASALLGWALVPLALLSLLETQQPHYGLPGVPALALLFAGALEGAPRAARRLLAGLAAALALGLAVAALAPATLAGVVRLDPALAPRIAGDASLRAGALLAAAALAGCLSLRAPAWLAGAAWRRAVGATAVLLAFCTLALARIDPLLVPRELLAHPAVAGAARLEAPSSLRSVIRLYAGRTEVDTVAEQFVAAELAAEPGMVALVWEGDLPRVRSAPGAESVALEEVARGFAKGRILVALRAARAPAAAPPAAPATTPGGLSPPPASP